METVSSTWKITARDQEDIIWRLFFRFDTQFDIISESDSLLRHAIPEADRELTAMSRMSIAVYLHKAKESLSRSLKSKGEHPASFVIGNGSADLDSIACALVYGYIQSSTAASRKADRYLVPVTNIPASQLRLRPELAALLKHANLKPSDLVTLDDLGTLHDTLPPKNTDWTLVDHNVLQGALGQHYMNRVNGVIDHHDDEGRVPKDVHPRIIEKTGSCSSHVVNFYHEDWDSLPSSASTSTSPDYTEDTSNWNAQVAKLALGAILIDTVNFKAEDKVTQHDRKAVNYLEDRVKASLKDSTTWDRDNFFQEIDDAKSNLDDLTIQEILEKDYKEWKEGDLTLGISCCVRGMDYLKAKDEDLVSIIERFAKDRELDLYALMTAHNDNSSFERQLLLLSTKDGKAKNMAVKFEKSDSQELKLHESNTEIGKTNMPWLKLWEQKNLTASRKQVGPALRNVMSRQ